MSDIKAIEISDVLGLSQPLTKLIETVSCGLGRIYEPTHIKRIAKAKASGIKLISDGICDNYQLPIKYDDMGVTITSEGVDLLRRAENRFMFQEMKKQQNIESAIANAYATLEKIEEVSNEPVNEDWISSFFNFIANVSDEKMQILWGKLLAGEIKQPGSVSIRTLDTLRKLTHKEVVIFQKIAPYVLHCVGDNSKSFQDYFLIDEETPKDILNEAGITFPDILTLRDTGLLTYDRLISVGFDLKPTESESVYSYDKKVEIRNNSESDVKFTVDAYLLTSVGSELYKTFFDNVNFNEYDMLIEKYLKRLSDAHKFAPNNVIEDIQIKIVSI